MGAESLKCSLRLAADGMTEGKVGVSTPIVCYRAERVMEVPEDCRSDGASRKRNDNLPIPLCR